MVVRTGFSEKLTFLKKLIRVLIYLAVLGLHCCMVFSSCTEWGLLSLWGVKASHCGGSPCCRAQALGHWDFSSCGTWVQKLQLLGSRALAQ